MPGRGSNSRRRQGGGRRKSQSSRHMAEIGRKGGEASHGGNRSE